MRLVISALSALGILAASAAPALADGPAPDFRLTFNGRDNFYGVANPQVSVLDNGEEFLGTITRSSSGRQRPLALFTSALDEDVSDVEDPGVVSLVSRLSHTIVANQGTQVNYMAVDQKYDDGRVVRSYLHRNLFISHSRAGRTASFKVTLPPYELEVKWDVRGTHVTYTDATDPASPLVSTCDFTGPAGRYPGAVSIAVTLYDDGDTQDALLLNDATPCSQEND